ncbi:MAG TPA: hypothetical protein VGE34_03805 [Candidatus Saccharimonadales bacterium]
MYTLKSIAQRGTMLGAAFALVAAVLVPAAPAFADALNPLTERSLLLSSSAPGWQDTDGSGNSNAAPNSIGENYAPAGSGPNGKKTGEKFSFKVSSTADIKAFTLQYCKEAAGKCRAPGDNTGSVLTTNRQANDGVGGGWENKTSDLNVEDGFDEGAGAGQFQVFIGGIAQTGWSFATDNKEDATHTSGINTGKNNYITLSKGTATNIANGTVVTIVFKASESVFITNPGSGAFFVKMNTYDSDTTGDHVPGGSHNIDGGVTVANMMTDSIHITTKVLETMAFSVGVHNRDTDDLDGPAGPTRNGTCDPIQVVDNNRLQLGNPDAEYSLETGRAWDVNSYWRLSSNSSGGATVYYSGDTLRNTVGDFIKPLDPSATLSNPGTEQFGLGFVNDSEMQSEVSPSFQDEITNDPDSYHLPSIAPLAKETAYQGGSGQIGDGTASPITAQFAFDEDSLTTPAVIAQNNNAVLSCATAKMRYVGNIAADTPAGVYTTKINYLAAPQY